MTLHALASPLDQALLDVRRLSAGYGDLRAVWDVSLVVRKSQITLLLGRNGAGKTTTLSAIAGLLKASGTIALAGRDISSLAPHSRARSGLALVQEGKRVFRQRTVEENLQIGGYTLPRAGRAPAIEKAYARFPMLGEKRRALAGALSGGQQQMLAIAQALMADPALLMLDEPSAGLAPSMVDEVLAAVRTLAYEGVGVLLVEQTVEQALPVADWVVVIDRGVSVMGVPRDDLAQDQFKLQQVYLGLDEATGLTGPPSRSANGPTQ